MFPIITLLAAFVLSACGPTSSSDQSSVDPSSSDQTSVDVSSSEPVSSEKVVNPTGIVISSADDVTSIEVGETLQLTASVLPEGAVQTVTWSSADVEKATVSSDGLVTAVSVGNVFIVAKSTADENVTRQFALSVKEAPIPVITPESITITVENDSTTVEQGASLQLSAVVNPVGADQIVRWNSSDEFIATVSSDGLVRGLLLGEVTITAISVELETVTATVTLEVVQATAPDPTVDWADIDYTTHENYMSSKNGDMLKVKGRATHVAPVTSSGLVNYYVQDGTDGYYIYGQDTTFYPVEQGKVYEIGGEFKNYNGTRELVNIEHVVELEENIEVTVSDLSDIDVTSSDLTDPYHGSWVEIKAALIQTLPSNYGAAFTVKVGVNGKTFDFRVDPTYMSGDDFTAIGDKFKNAPEGSPIDALGIMSAFGYGRPSPQLLIMHADDIATAELTAADKVELAATALEINQMANLSVTAIELPTSLEGFDDVVITWATEDASLVTASGVVNHGARTVYVTLTATLSVEGETATKEFRVTVFGSDNSLLTESHVLDLDDAGEEQQYGLSSTKPSYSTGNDEIELGTPLATWYLRNSLIARDSNDKYNGAYAIRTQSNADANRSGRIELRTDFDFNLLEFNAAIFGNNKLGSILDIEYSTDSGETWVTVDGEILVNNYALETYRVLIPSESANRVALSYRAGTGQRLNIDDIRLLIEA